MFIDLRSDTVTKPTKAMREAMMHAEVGDDVYKEDPTVNRLEEAAAEILGKEAALFVTSGTQGNQVAVLTHAKAGDEMILEAESHIFYYEAAAVAALAGVQTRTVNGTRGAMEPQAVEAAIRGEDIHFPNTTLICVENTHNRGGGAILPLQNLAAIQELSIQYKVPVHMDGARLFNAAVALGIDVKTITQYVNTVQVCLSKGLGAPVGSILAGSHEFIEQARKWRKRLGGGLRQAGVIAAPGYLALTTMVDRLAEDHENAKRLAIALADTKGFTIDPKLVETNILMVDISKTGYDSNKLVLELERVGVLASSFGPTLIRMVTHKDVNRQDIDEAIKRIQQVARQI